MLPKMQALSKNSRSKLIFALDLGGDMDEAIRWADLLKDHVGMLKIGKEAFTRFGPSVVSRIIEKGGNVFLDLKFYDIPNTVAMASEAAVKLGISMLNIHALGGSEMMERAVDSVNNTAKSMGIVPPILLAVTVLTSLDDSNLKEMGFKCSTRELALKLAVSARKAGISGVVASAQDVTRIREACGKDFIIVTPGIRLGSKVAGDDQKRVLTPRDAITMGADYIVVGRPIRLADDPVAVADRISEEISRGLA
ncbi:MAG: orotidine-5'-phosphate decarboxylase [Thermodesulfobacteriota bacterium]|nr:orotidine-5'-phosphate decarboxylase [Thermodesulfobacteriota bacterium]